MTITFANTSDEYYKVKKTYTTVSTFSNASIVYPCDIHNPTFKIKGGKIDANSITGVFGRNYWITGQTLCEGINYITCTVDPFSSFQNDIIGSTQFVNRSEKYGEKYLPDTLYPVSSKTEITMLKGARVVSTGFSYVLGVI